MKKSYKWKYGCEAHCPKCDLEIPILMIAELENGETKELKCVCGQIIIKPPEGRRNNKLTNDSRQKNKRIKTRYFTSKL